MASVFDLSKNDIFRLIDFIREADVVLEMINDDISFCYYLSEENFAVIKSAALFFGRVSKLLNIPIGSCLAELPVVSLKDSDNESFQHEIEEIVYGDNFSICENYYSCLCETGIVEDGSWMYPDTIDEMRDEIMEEFCKEGSGKMTDEDRIEEIARARLKNENFAELSKYFPEFADTLIDLVHESRFYASGIVYLHSRRVGNFVKNRKKLKRILGNKLFDAVNYMIDAVFEPLYDIFPDFTLFGTLNADGEYCSVYCIGDFEDRAERICSFNKRPYANLALALLHRLLTDAEKLAPELLLEKGKEVTDAA